MKIWTPVQLTYFLFCAGKHSQNISLMKVCFLETQKGAKFKDRKYYYLVVETVIFLRSTTLPSSQKRRNSFHFFPTKSQGGKSSSTWGLSRSVLFILQPQAVRRPLSFSLSGRKRLTDAQKKDRKKPLELRMTDWDHQNNKSRITAAKAKQAAITSYTAKQMHWRKFEKKNISLSSDVYIRTDEKTTATIQVWASKSEWHLGHRAGSP